MARYVAVAKVSDVPENSLHGVVVEGQNILIVNLAGRFYAIGDVCTHEECLLSQGFLTGETITCPCHVGQFNIKTGEVLGGPPEYPEPVYEVKVEEDSILAKLE